MYERERLCTFSNKLISVEKMYHYVLLGYYEFFISSFSSAALLTVVFALQAENHE
jgi:hypothetical protein